MLPKGEKKISLEEAATFKRREYGGKKPHVMTVLRWCLHGLRGVVLESDKCGGGARVTTEEAVIRFFQRCAEPKQIKAQATRMPSIESIAAEQELIAQGF